jgi:DNA polymerase III delta prime subunit
METELSIHTDIKNKLQYFVSTNKIPHIIFHGVSGSGKRHIVNFLVNEIYKDCGKNYEDYIKYVNCAHGKGIRFIRDDLKYFAKTNINNKIYKFKSIVLFNADKLTIDAQSALRRCIETFSTSTRFFIVVEDKNKLLKPILSRFCKIYIPLPNIDCNFQSLHKYKRKLIGNNVELKGRQLTLLTYLKNKKNFSSITKCQLLIERLYEKGYSALDIMKVIENDKKIDKKFKYTSLIYFDKIRKEFRNEKLLILLIFYKFFMRKDVILENIDEM